MYNPYTSQYRVDLPSVNFTPIEVIELRQRLCYYTEYTQIETERHRYTPNTLIRYTNDRNYEVFSKNFSPLPVKQLKAFK